MSYLATGATLAESAAGFGQLLRNQADKLVAKSKPAGVAQAGMFGGVLGNGLLPVVLIGGGLAAGLFFFIRRKRNG